jgi:adenylate cyclase
MSGDPEQEYFSDGISEDIITDLSKVSALWVAARNTSFTFKGNHVDVPQVARQLKVSHVLEGSVRKAGGRVRITAQLVDGARRAATSGPSATTATSTTFLPCKTRSRRRSSRP